MDEGDPAGLPGTYLASFYETRPLPYAEAGYGYPESGQTVVNVTDGKLIRLLVDDEPLDLRYGELLSHERTLDLRRGVLERVVEWRSPAGKKVRIRSTRLVSLTRRSLLAIDYRVEPIDEPLRLVVQSELVANEPASRQSQDPRVTAVIEDALEPVEHHAEGLRSVLLHRTRSSELQLATGMDHEISAPHGHTTDVTAQHPDWARVAVSTSLNLGEELRLVKFVAYGWSSQRSAQSLRDQVSAALLSARDDGWDRVRQEHEAAYSDFWSGADVELDGPVEIQQAVRFDIFHAYQAGARAERRAIAAKGLTGTGYDGHAFWDTESFVLPLLTATAPAAARGRASLAAVHAGPRQGTGRDAAAGRCGVPLADDPRPGVLRAGRRAQPPCTSTPTSRWPRPVTCGGPPTRILAGPARCRCWSRPPACGCHWATREVTRGSTSTGSPDRTSTPRCATTTSTRT